MMQKLKKIILGYMFFSLWCNANNTNNNEIYNNTLS